jgi:hypothetical protein
MPSSDQGFPRRGLILALGAIAIAAIAFVLVNRQPAPPVDTVARGNTTRLKSIADGELELSGVAHVPNSSHILVLDDDTPGEIFLVEIGRDTAQAGDAVPVKLGLRVRDMEGITTDGTHFYVVGSQSKEDGFEGPGLIRFRYDPATRQAQNVESVDSLKAWLADNIAELAGTARQTGDHVLNIEALAWDPGGGRLLLGLRAPVVDGQALVVPVRLADPRGAFSRDNLRPDGPSIRIDLRGAGIRSLEFDPESAAYHIISGATLNEETSDFRVYRWDGRSSTPERELAVYSKTLKPEGIANAEMFGKRTKVIVFDIGTFLLTD